MVPPARGSFGALADRRHAARRGPANIRASPTSQAIVAPRAPISSTRCANNFGATPLDTFARSPDLGIALQAVRNVNASPETLERVYRTHPYRDYFLQALAEHPNTPAPILREIHALQPAPITGLDIAFAGNPSAPTDVLLDLARSSEEIEAVRTLLRHPALDCAMIEGVVRGPAVRSHPDDADVTERLANARATRCR